MTQTNMQAVTTPQERDAALAAALYHFGAFDPDRIENIAASLLANYAYQRDRLARVAAGTACTGDADNWPDDSYMERDHEYVTREIGARRFVLERKVDETGVSGIGQVAEGVVARHGRVAMHWRTEHRSVAFYRDIEAVERIHGHGGKTRIVFATGGPS